MTDIENVENIRGTEEGGFTNTWYLGKQYEQQNIENVKSRTGTNMERPHRGEDAADVESESGPRFEGPA